MSTPREMIEVIAEALNVVANSMEAAGYPPTGDVAVLRKMSAARRAEADIGRLAASGQAPLPSVVMNTLRAVGMSADGMVSKAEFDVKASAAGIDNQSRI